VRLTSSIHWLGLVLSDVGEVSLAVIGQGKLLPNPMGACHWLVTSPPFWLVVGARGRREEGKIREKNNEK